MTPIIEQDTILTSQIDEEKHLVVAVIQGSPYILTNRYKSDETLCRFHLLNNRFTTGNYNTTVSEYGSIQDKVEHLIRLKMRVAVFTYADWKQALQWLLDNA